MKDLFSSHADDYARYRPVFPDAFFRYLETLIPEKQLAWDCGTGNGQVAVKLAECFDSVCATDISAAQLKQAPARDNIFYSVQPAEKTNFPDHSFDLILVAQAIHWFDFEAFYREVKRTARQGAFLVVIGYGKLRIDPQTDMVIDRLYHSIIGPYWDEERRYIDELYQTIPFPFEEIATPGFEHTVEWNLEQLTGYLGTWSAVKHYIRENGNDPVPAISNELKEIKGETATFTVHFPLLLRIGKIRN